MTARIDLTGTVTVAVDNQHHIRDNVITVTFRDGQGHVVYLDLSQDNFEELKVKLEG